MNFKTALLCVAALALIVSVLVPAAARAETEKERQIEFMRDADREAAGNLTSSEGGPFGAVIVKDGKIVGRGHNRVIALHDPTAHAEVSAIRDACAALATHDLTGCELYTSCYPCPMCLSAAIWANIKTIYYGNTPKDAEEIGFRDDYIYRFIEGGRVDESVLKMEQIGRSETIQTFEAYAKKQDKQLY